MMEPNSPGDAGVGVVVQGESSSRSSDVVAVALPALLTLTLCLFRIGARQPWQDEHATWIAATRSLDGFARLIQHVDVVLAPYYLLMRGWSALFGDSIPGMRVPSALAMSGSAALLSLLGKRLFDRQVGLLAGLIFALLPVVSRYGQEARPSALATFGVLLSTLLCVRAFHEGSKPSWGRCAAYASSIAFVGLAHLVALSVLGAHAATFLAFRRTQPHVVFNGMRDRIRSFAVSACAGLLVVAPLIFYGRGQSGQLRQVDLTLATVFPMWSQLFLPKILGWVLVPCAVFGMFRRHALRSLLITWALLPPLWLFACYEFLHIFRARYLVFTLSAWALLAAAALLRPSLQGKARWLVPAPFLALLVLLGFPKQSAWRDPSPAKKSDFRGAAAQIASLAQSSDAVTYVDQDNPQHARRALQYELRRGPALRDIFVQQSAEAAEALDPRECRRAEACLPADVTRIWLVTDAPLDHPFQGMKADRAKLLQGRFQPVFRWDSNATRLVLLQRKR